jgi:protein-disulfide isomerase
MQKGNGMSKRYGWFIFLVALALLLAACGPPLATPTPKGQEPVADSPTATREENQPTQEVATPGDLPVDPSDWRALGSPDAPVTVIEYSDFQ